MATHRNSILNAVSSEVCGRLRLKPVEFEVGREIEFPGQPIRNIFFVEQGMASMTTTFQDGSQVEVSTFGRESVIGISALMGSRRSLNRVYTQIAGSGFMCSLADARAEFERAEVFQDVCLRYVQSQLLQAMQLAGCNARHEVEPRLARWLLLCADRVGSDTFVLSHEFLADMLGTTRSTVTVAALSLQKASLIAYSRGNIRILDRAGLQRRACECYCIVTSHLHNPAEFDSGTTN